MIKIADLNHVNVITYDLECSARFYEKLGLQRGVRPDFGNTGIWLYAGGKPKVHLNLASEVNGVTGSCGAFHHVGFDVPGKLDDIAAELTRLNIDWELWPVPVRGWYRALYFKGPSGEEIEFVLIDEPGFKAVETTQQQTAA